MAKELLRIAVIFGANMQARRKEKDISQAKVAEFLGITEQSVSRMERGKISPDFSRLEPLAAILDCTVVDFFCIPDKLKKTCAQNLDDMSTGVDPRSKILEHAEKIIYLASMMGETPYKDRK